MATNLSGDVLRGLGFMEPRVKLANLQARGVTTTSSAYTEASPRAGTPEAQQATDMALEATGTPSQSGNIRIQCQRAGHPGLEKAGIIWSDQTQASPVWYGWDGPQIVSGWEPLRWNPANDYVINPHVIRLQSGKLLAVVGQSNLGTLPLFLERYDPATSTWTALSSVTLEDEVQQSGPGLLQLPSGRVLLFTHTSGVSADQVDCYYSDDEGTSWEVYSLRILTSAFSTPASTSVLRPAYNNGQIVMFAIVDPPAAPEDIYQLASDDLGASFTQVAHNWTGGGETPSTVDVVPIQGGGFVVAYGDDDLGGGASIYGVRRIGSAYENADDADDINIGTGWLSTFYVSLSMWDDENGTLYLMCNTTGQSANGEVYRSVDSGLSWQSMAGDDQRGMNLQSAAAPEDYWERWSCAMTGGRTAMVTRWVATTATEDPDSISCVWLGGFSTHTAPAGTGKISFKDYDYVSFSEDVGNEAGGLWMPVEEPQNTNWTPSAGGGTETLVATGELEIDTIANNQCFSRTTTGAANACFAEFALEIDAGDGSLASPAIGAQIRLADAGGYEYHLEIRLDDTGYRLYDLTAAATIADTTGIDFTSRLHLRVAMDKGNVLTWYATDAHERQFVEGAGGAITDAGVTANNDLILWGHIANGTVTSRWALVGYCYWPASWGPMNYDTIGASWSSPDDLHPRSVTSLPALVFDGVSVAAVSGPAKFEDQWDIKQDSDYSAANMLWQVEPSPSRGTRTTGEIEAKYVFDLNGLSEAGMRGSSVFVGLLRTNVETAVLESSANGAIWGTVATMSASTDLDNLQHTRTGEIVYPLKGGAAHKAGRYLYADDLAGGTFHDTVTPKLRRIASNSNGAWTDETSAIPYVYLEGVDDTEAASGACEIWVPDMFEIVHMATIGTARYLRLRIPAQTTADGYFEIGQFVVGWIEPFGHQYGRGWNVVRRPVQEIEELPNGSLRAVQRGRPLDEVEISWPDAVDSTQPDTKNPVPDYVSGDAARPPLASVGDTIQNMAGIIRQQRGAETPVVYFGSIIRDTGGTAANNPRQFLYSRIVSDFERSNVLGSEVTSELNRGGRVLLREIT